MITTIIVTVSLSIHIHKDPQDMWILPVSLFSLVVHVISGWLQEAPFWKVDQNENIQWEANKEKSWT